MEWNPTQPWYHGSPLSLRLLHPGSTITQDYDLARVFSHKPTLVCQQTCDNGVTSIKHSGTDPGFLYRITEDIQSADIVPVPHSTMEPGQEWHITRPIAVEYIEATVVRPTERLTEEEIADLYCQLQKNDG